MFGGEGLHGLASIALGRGEGWGRLGEPQAKAQSCHPDCFCLQPSQVSWRRLSLCLCLGQAVLAESSPGGMGHCHICQPSSVVTTQNTKHAEFWLSLGCRGSRMRQKHQPRSDPA